MAVMRYSKATIQALVQRLDILDIIRGYVEKLENRGGRWWSCCPFHSENTPSFSIDPERGNYYCFGCQEKGDAIHFVMKLEGLSFPEALRNLAERCGFALPHSGETEAQAAERQKARQQREALFGLYAKVHKHFRENLCGGGGAIARSYLEQRGINEQTSEHFALGYAVQEGQALYRFLRQSNYSADLLRESGLFSQRKHESCLFWQRLMFPVFNAEGKVIAFSGRILQAPAQPDGYVSPKYINSRESPIYQKRESLFGLYQSLKNLRRERSLILCEGNLDVLAWHQSGIECAAAPLGTAFTAQQARLLKRYCDTVVLAFDGDEAGERAIYKAAFLLEQESIGSQVISFPPGRDPADLLQHEGAEALQKLSPKDFFHFLDHNLKQRFALDELTGAGMAVSFLSPFMSQLAEGLRRELYMTRLAAIFGLKPEVLAAEPSWRYREVSPAGPRPEPTQGPRQTNPAPKPVAQSATKRPSGKTEAKTRQSNTTKTSLVTDRSDVSQAEREFWASMLLQADLYPKWQEQLDGDCWQSEEALLLKNVLDQSKQNFNFETLCDRVSRIKPEFGHWLLQKQLEPLQQQLVHNTEGYDMLSYREAILQQKYFGLQSFWLKQRRNQAMQQLLRLEGQTAESTTESNGPEPERELLREIQNLDARLGQLGKNMQELQKNIQLSSEAQNIPI